MIDGLQSMVKALVTNRQRGRNSGVVFLLALLTSSCASDPPPRAGGGWIRDEAYEARQAQERQEARGVTDRFFADLAASVPQGSVACVTMVLDRQTPPIVVRPHQQPDGTMSPSSRPGPRISDAKALELYQALETEIVQASRGRYRLLSRSRLQQVLDERDLAEFTARSSDRVGGSALELGANVQIVVQAGWVAQGGWALRTQVVSLQDATVLGGTSGRLSEGLPGL